MPDHELAMLAYAMLARVSQEKRQFVPRDKFLVLAGAAACHAGWPEVAERCRHLVLEHNPLHQLDRFPSFVEAMRGEEVPLLLKPLQRFCSYERAEHLLHELGLDPMAWERDVQTAGERALRELNGPAWNEAAE